MISAASRTDFDILKKRERVLHIEQEMARPGFWEDKRRAAELSREIASLKRDIQRWDRLSSEVQDLHELFLMARGDEHVLGQIKIRTDALERAYASIKTELLFSGKYDKGNAMLSIYSGAGGKDAEDWAAILYRMYLRFAERKGWNVKMIHEHWGEFQGPAGWGIKNVTILVSAPAAYGYLKKESGVHRLVRISPFSAQSLRHTSFALVDVMPELVSPEEVEIKPEDLKIDFFRSSGPGGQNVNKRETAVRLRHVPTGLQVASQAERSQESNRQIAMELLRSRLYQRAIAHQEQEQRGVRQAAHQSERSAPSKTGREKVSIEWGSQIRSYVMHPYQMVKDHRTNYETSQIDKVLDGDLEKFIEAEVKLETSNK